MNFINTDTFNIECYIQQITSPAGVNVVCEVVMVVVLLKKLSSELVDISSLVYISHLIMITISTMYPYVPFL